MYYGNGNSLQIRCNSRNTSTPFRKAILRSIVATCMICGGLKRGTGNTFQNIDFEEFNIDSLKYIQSKALLRTNIFVHSLCDEEIVNYFQFTCLILSLARLKITF